MQKSKSQEPAKPSRTTAARRSRKAIAGDSIDIMTHEEVRIMSTRHREPGVPMDIEEEPRRDLPKVDEAD